jgi:putative hydrolase of the HAD superfamily
VELLDGVEGTISQLARSYQLVVVTKGDIFDQESKLARSGLGEYFSSVEIVREKDRSTYEAIAKRYGVPTANLLMVGDSLKSDVIPVLEAGGHAIHIPYGTPWQYELVGEDVSGQYEFPTAESMVLVPDIIEGIA